MHADSETQKQEIAMKTDIILAGVGGQGILSIATVIGEAATVAGLNLKQAEVHGMSQRGGDVQSHLRLSTEPIYSDLIPKGKADLIIAMEPMEALRYRPWLTEGGKIISSSEPLVNIPAYPDLGKILESLRAVPLSRLLPIESMAKNAGMPRGANMILLGMAALQMEILTPQQLREAIGRVFESKGSAVAEANRKAFDIGLNPASNSFDLGLDPSRHSEEGVRPTKNLQYPANKLKS